jgi:hypothetical protein
VNASNVKTVHFMVVFLLTYFFVDIVTNDFNVTAMWIGLAALAAVTLGLTADAIRKGHGT